MRKFLKFLVSSTIALTGFQAHAQTVTTIPVTGNLTQILGTPSPYAGVKIDLENCPAPITIPGQSSVVQTEIQIQADASGNVNSTVWPTDKIDCNGTTGNAQYGVVYVVNGVPTANPVCYAPSSTAGVWNLNTTQPITCGQTPPNPQDATYNNITVAQNATVNNLNVTGTISSGSSNTWAQKQNFNGGAAVLNGLSTNTVQTSSVDGCIWVDGTVYPNTATGINSAITAAAALGGCVHIPPGNYSLTNEIYVAPSVRVFAYGATLTWTAFGSAPACIPNNATGTISAANCHLTGNGIRMESNTGWYGGTIVGNNVPAPCTSSTDGAAPAADCTGEFWNQIVIGRFSPTTLIYGNTMANGVANVTIQDVHLQLLAGNRNIGIDVEGLASNIVVRNVVDDHTSTSTQLPAASPWVSGGDTSYDATWGADNTYIYRPHKLTIDNYTVNGYLSSTTSPAASDVQRGVDLSGVYDVSMKGLSINDTQLPMTIYFGDPGDCVTSCTGGPSSTLPSFNGSGQVATGMTLRDSSIWNFNIGIQILGDPSGGSLSAHGTNAVRVKIDDVNLYGLGPAATYGAWTSNIGVFNSQADNWRLSGSTIQNVYDGVNFSTIGAGATYKPLQGIDISGNEIHNLGRMGIRALTTYKATIHDNNIWLVGQDATVSGRFRSCVYNTGFGNRIYANTCGNVSDPSTAQQYGIYTDVDSSGKLTPTNGANNILYGNQVNAANLEAYDGTASVYVADTFTNTVYGSIPFSADPSYPVLNASSVQVGGVSVIPSTTIGVHGNGTRIQYSDGTGTPGNFAKWDANGNVIDGGAGTFPTQGIATLTAGAVTVSSAAACSPGSSCHYQLTHCTAGGTIGILSLGTVSSGTSFVINSSSASDTSQVCWQIN